MLGLQGNNVKLSLKPTLNSSPAKKSGSKVSRKEDSTDSDSGVGLQQGKRNFQRRRINSAALDNRKPKLGQRKLSVPEDLIVKNSMNCEDAKMSIPMRRLSKCDDNQERERMEPVGPQILSVDSTCKEFSAVVPPSNSRQTSSEDDNHADPLEYLSSEIDSESGRPSVDFDRLLLAESDQVIEDVVNFCNEIGIDSSEINATRLRTKKKVTIVVEAQVHQNYEQQSPESEPSLEDKDNVAEDLSNLDLDCQGNNIPDGMQYVTTTATADFRTQNFEPAPVEQFGDKSEDPDSSRVYDRLISTLRLIEQDQDNNCNPVTKVAGSESEAMIIQHQWKNAASHSHPQNCPQSPISTYFYASPPVAISTPNSPTQKYPRSGRSAETVELEEHEPNLKSVSALSMSFSTSDINSVVCSSRLSHRDGIGRRVKAGGELGSTMMTSTPSPVPIDKELTCICPSPFVPEVVPLVNEKSASKIYSFLDQVEKLDRDLLFSLKFDKQSSGRDSRTEFIKAKGNNTMTLSNGISGSGDRQAAVTTMDSLIRKGSVEIAKELLLLQRKYEDSLHSTRVLEDTLLSQRELNMRNLKNSEKDLRKRLKLQQEEFELALSRHQSFMDQLLAEKRSLQDKCEKLLLQSKESESKYQTQMKSLQEKHLEEIKRLRRVQEIHEKANKQKWLNSKSQEIRQMTVKGLEPDVQRLIHRHQQEMTEVRAWHADEIQEIEERFRRKQITMLQEMKEQFAREKSEIQRREREKFDLRLGQELEKAKTEFGLERTRLISEFGEERQRFLKEKDELRDVLQENVRKAEIKSKVEIETLQQDNRKLLESIEKRHENQLKSLKDVYEEEKENAVSNLKKKHDQSMLEHAELILEQFKEEKHVEMAEKEKKLRAEFELIRRQDEEDANLKFKRVQDKFQSEMAQLEKTESELKQKLNSLKSEVLSKDEQLFSMKTSLASTSKENQQLSESNLRMNEERVNLTSAIRHEFKTQIESLEDECTAVKSAVMGLKAKHRLELESMQLEREKCMTEKDAEIEKIGFRVKQALDRKEETLMELQNQLEKRQVQCEELERLLEQQRQEFVSSLVVSPTTTSMGNSAKVVGGTTKRVGVGVGVGGKK